MISVLTTFEERTRVHPDAIAVSFAGRRVTYTQLNDRANQIGRVLRDAGVVAESLVAIFLERTPELVASLLGVWKAGGAYLPIDPTNPPQRVEFTLEDSAVSYVLTQRSLLGSLPPTKAKVLCMEDIPVERGMNLLPFVPASPSPRELAYVIYTSGSTGKPKGAGVCHDGLLNVVQAISHDLALRERDVALATATIAFDISNLELYVPLTSGATIHLMERHFAGDGLRLIELIRTTNAALVFGTPTSWRLMLEAGWKGSPNLQIITGGEVLPLSLARTLTRMTRAVWNHYGPTETSICATREQILPDAEIITLGWPIENVRIYVLDESQKPVETAEIGEIYIGGIGVGRGYLNRAELTARSFVTDPFEEHPGARMYKTGDLGRLLPDGRLDFQGRADNQIKLRGFRIELEEIEAAVHEFSGVNAASVQVVDYAPGDKRLVAYFLADDTVTVERLRDFLRQRLPYFMLPSELIPIEELPMTINGKIDREALDRVRIEFESQERSESTRVLHDDLEAELRGIWQRLLKVRSIGPDDDFFDLGGHSLLATRMFADIEKITGRRIPLSALILNPTVAKLAAYIHSRPEIDWPGLVPIQDRGSLPPLFIAHGLGSNLLLFRTLAEQLGPDQPVQGIQLAAPANATLDELRIEAFAARYVDEILAIDPVGPYYLAGHSLGGLLVFEIASQLRKRGREIGMLALLDCNLHVAQRSKNLPPADPISFEQTVAHWRKKASRFLEGGIVNTIWRKLLYKKLMYKIELLRLTHREGHYHPQIFGLDPYIALFAEGYQPQSIHQDVVLFVAEDELTPESAARGWSEVVRGRLEVRKIPGSHQTIFVRPNVETLAADLKRRLDLSSRSGSSEVTSFEAEKKSSMTNPLLEYHGG